jgi:hypothetical protein
MIKSGGVSFDKIPALFISKFPVYLFMDGKDCYGNNVRERLLDTEDEYIIFTILHESLIDENFNALEIDDVDNNYINMISNFINFLPNRYQVITEKEIMNYYNEKDDNSNAVIFRETETEKQECDEKISNNYMMNE